MVSDPSPAKVAPASHGPSFCTAATISSSPMPTASLRRWAGRHSAFAGALAAIALLAAVAVAALVPHVAPAARPRSNMADLARNMARADFLRPVLLLGAATAALSAGVGFLPVLGARHQLSPLATGALVSLLAAVAAVVQPWAGRRLDAGRLPPASGAAALILCAAGFAAAIAVPDAAGIAVAAVLTRTGVAVATPLGFTLLAVVAPPGRLGATMGAAEVGRELGDAGGPVLVGAFGLVSLTAGIGALAVALLACAGLVAPRTRQAGPGTSGGPR